MNLGTLHREFARLDESTEAFRTVIGMFPGVAAGHASLGVSLYEAGDSDSAIAASLEAVNLDPLYLDAHENLKKIRWLRGEHDRMDESFRSACARLPNSARAFRSLGAALLVSHDYAGAERALLRATQLEPSLGDAFHGLGQAYFHLDRLPDALTAHARAVSCGPENSLFREDFGAALLHAGEYQRAVDELRAGHRWNPRRSSILAYLSIALNALGDRSVDVLVDYEKFVRIAQIDVPDGDQSLEAFNADLHQELKTHFHDPYHPMGQTMRGGTETPNDLLQNPTGLIRVLKEQISKAARKFVDDPEPDLAQPFLRFIKRGFVFTGVWSTIIEESSYDCSHIHNEGWMSGTNYAKVPEFDHDWLS